MTRAQDIFVGRERELAELTAALDEALAGRGRLVMLVGEPGIGKTRLAEEFADIARDRGAEVFWGRCPEERGAPPYWPWVQVIRGLTQSHPATVASEIVERISGLSDTDPAESPEAARFRLFDSVAEFLKSAARTRPLLLIFDDLHWADASSLAMLEFFAPAITDSPILVVGMYRDVEVDRGHPLFHALGGLSRLRTFARVPVRQLSQPDVEAVIGVATSASPPRGLSTLVHKYTAGNPLFVRELVRFLDQEGRLTQAHLADLQSGRTRLPEGIREVIGRRMDRLSEPCNEVMRVASVIGIEFGEDLVRRITPTEPLMEALDEAVDARIIEHVTGTSGQYRFTHALFQRTLQDEIPRTRRVRLHALIAEALETQYGARAGEHAGEIAAHLAEAGGFYEPEKLMNYSMLAGEQALNSLGFHEAVHYFDIAEQAAGELRRAVEAQGHWDAESERSHGSLMARIWFDLGRASAGTASLRDDRQRAWDILRGAFTAYLGLGEKEKAVEVARTGMDFAGIEGLVDVTGRAVQVAEPDSVSCGHLLTRYAIALLDEHGDLSGARDALKKTLAIANLRQDRRLEALAHVHLSHIAFAECDYTTCIDEGLISLGVGGEADDHVAVRVYAFVIPAMVSSGDQERPRSFADAFLKVSTRLRISSWLAHARVCAWTVAAARGDQEAMRIAREELATGNDEPSFAMAAFLEASEHISFGPQGSGAEALRSVFAQLKQFNYFQADIVLGILATAAHRQRDSTLISAAETLARQMLSGEPVLPRDARPARQGLGFVAAARGDSGAATALYPEVLLSNGQFGRCATHSVDRLLGLLATTMGNVPAAEGHFADAVRACQKAGFLPELAWACHDYGELLLASGTGPNRHKAEQLIHDGTAVATDLGMQPLIHRLAALQSRAAATPPGRPVIPAGLSEREVEVLRLIAAGRSNAQIAEALVITPNTAAKHVANILTKIGAANRTEAATFANKHGLVS